MSNGDEPTGWMSVSFASADPLWVFSITAEDDRS